MGTRAALVLAAALWFPAAWSAAEETTAPRTADRGEVKIFLIALEDNGRRGEKVGCGDSVVPVAVELDTTSGPLTAALTRLLSPGLAVPGRPDGRELYNALSESELAVRRVEVKEGTATIELTGRFRIGGACDAPRVEAQLRRTALQFPGMKKAVIRVNGTPLERLLQSR